MPDWPTPPSPEERKYGTELLKRAMLEQLGVDVEHHGRYDDSQTIKDAIRRDERMEGTIGNLEIYKNEMEQNLRKPIVPREVMPPPRSIRLDPIEHNPFDAKLIPTEDDPFASSGQVGT